jgi:hypothetical protein
MSAWADGVARGWTDLYTGGLPSETAERRREEIRSDLFEHAAYAGTTPAHQLHVLGRVLWGIPADLSWRRAARAPRERRLATGEIMTLRKTTTALVALGALFNVWAAIGVWIGAGAEDEGDAGGARYGIPMLLAAALMIYGLSCRNEAPRRSTVLIIIGAAAPMVVFYWMAPLFVPFWLVITGLVIASEPGRRAPAPAAT